MITLTKACRTDEWSLGKTAMGDWRLDILCGSHLFDSKDDFRKKVVQTSVTAREGAAVAKLSMFARARVFRPRCYREYSQSTLGGVNIRVNLFHSIALSSFRLTLGGARVAANSHSSPTRHTEGRCL